MSSAESPDGVFDLYSRYYDLLYADKDYAGEADYVAKTLRRLGINGDRILEFGCGTGRHARQLVQQGFCITGVERSEQMVQLATANHDDRFRAIVADIRHVRLSERFDAVISLFHVISYLTTTDDLSAAFRSASEHLGIGGVFLFDVWHGPAVLTQRPSVRVRQMRNDELEVTRIAEPELNSQDGIVTVNYTVFARKKGEDHWKSLSESHRMRYLFPTEIKMLAEQAGFEVAVCEEFQTGQLASDQTWGVTYGLRKVS